MPVWLGHINDAELRISKVGQKPLRRRVRSRRSLRGERCSLAREWFCAAKSEKGKCELLGGALGIAGDRNVRRQRMTNWSPAAMGSLRECGCGEITVDQVYATSPGGVAQERVQPLIFFAAAAGVLFQATTASSKRVKAGKKVA